MTPWLFLFVSLIGAGFTWNAYVPTRRLGPFIVPSFFMGWFTTELAVHHLVWQGLATLIFVAAGALSDWPGWLGLGISLASWVGLLGLVPQARRASAVVELALEDALGESYREAILPEIEARSLRDPEPRLHLNPFALRHPEVRVHRHIPYVANGGKRNQLDVYVPAAGVRNAPVLFQIHGGGWVIGNKHEQALPLMNHMASHGWVCVAANYRLSPKAKFPDHLIDLKRALHWIRENIAEYGGDPDFVVATGGSAGGHLSSMVALTAGDPAYQPGFEHVDTSVRACVPFYGVYDFTNHYQLQAQGGMSTFLERWIMKERLADKPDLFRRASPMHRLRPDAPPFFVIHGASDSLASVEEARHFARLLGEVSKEPVAYAELPGAQHAFEVFHSLRTDCVVASVDRFASWVYSRYLREREEAAA